MHGINDFRDLVAWQLAHQFNLLAQKLCERPAVKTRFKFRDQLSDAAESAPTNIAEGFGRFYHPEGAYFARIARLRKLKCRTTSSTTRDKGWLPGEEFRRHEHAVKKALKAVNGWIRYLEETPDCGKS